VRKRLGKGGEREDACVITRDEAAKVFPDGPVRSAGVDMTAPDPFAPALRTVLEKRGRLRVVDEYNVGALQLCTELVSIAAICLFVILQKRFRYLDLVPLKGVVESLRTLEEIGVSIDDFP
jgi:hypothetical protein